MKRILLILTFIFIGNSIKAQDISCKKIFPMPSGMEVGEVFNLPNNQYLINNKKYDQDFNLVHEFTNFFESTASNNVDVYQNKVFTTSKINSGIRIKLFDSNTNTMITSSDFGPLHSSDDSYIAFVTTGIDDNGNYYVFTVESNYFSWDGYRYYHRLYKFNNQLSLIYSKDYNTSSTRAKFNSFKIMLINNMIILSGLVDSGNYFNFDNMSIGSSSCDRIIVFAINPTDGSATQTSQSNIWLNGQFQNFNNVDIIKHNNGVYIISSDQTPSNENYLVLRKCGFDNNYLYISSIKKAKSSSGYFASMGAIIDNDRLIISAKANNGTIQYWGGNNITNNYSDIIWLETNLPDLSDSNTTISTSNTFIYNFQTIDNKMGNLFSKSTDGTVNIDEQSLYMQNEDIGFAVFSNDTGFKDIDFYTQTNPNSNNPNNYLNQDKPIRFKVKVKNELTQNLSSLTGIITSTTTGVSITNTNVSFSTMLSGDQTWSTDEFEITVDPSVANGTNLEFELSCNDPLVSGGPWTSYFSFPIAPLQTGTVVLVDNQGDNDGIPEPGENDIILQPKIDNISTQTFENVRGILSDVNGFLNITQDDYLYNVVSSVPQPINPGDTDVEPSLPFKFNYPANEAFQELNFNLELQANLNDASGTLLKWQSTFTQNDGVEPPPSLVSTNPIDNATDVAIDTDLILTFNKAITAVSGKNIYLYKNNSLDQTIATTDAMLSINNDIVTINLSTDLDGGANYYVITDAGAFIDANSLEFAGILTPTEWNFTTVQSNPPNAPVITATAISDSEIEITWSAVTDADTYNVYSCDETITYATGLTSTNYTATGLTGETQYGFIVKAENGAGLSVDSNCANDTTFCAVPWTSADIVTQGGIVTAYGIVTIDGQPATAFDKVGAFVGTELRAIGDIAMYNGDAYTTLAIESSGTETISFKVWDQSECVLVPVTFTVDASPTDVVGLPPNYLPIAGDTTASVTDNFITSISVYPNPTNDIIYIDNKENINIQKITLYNLLGKQVLQVKENTTQISTKTLTTGIYFINIQTKKGTLIKKIIKK